MERISEAGALYLKDYEVLTEARKDVERYLNAISEQVYNTLEVEKENIQSNNFEINVWQNQSSLGHLRVHLINKRDGDDFVRGEKDISIVYKDIRNMDSIKPDSAKIYVWILKSASRLKDKLSELSIDNLEENVFDELIVEFDLDNSMTTTENIVSEILNKIDSIDQLMDNL